MHVPLEFIPAKALIYAVRLLYSSCSGIEDSELVLLVVKNNTTVQSLYRHPRFSRRRK